MKRKTTGKESFFLWNNWETPKPSNTFFTGWPDAINLQRYRTGMTNLSPSTTSPEPGSPQPAGAFNWRLSEENSWPTQRQATDPSGPTTDDRSTNKKNWSLCVHFLKRACAPYDAILYYLILYIIPVCPFHMSGRYDIKEAKKLMAWRLSLGKHKILKRLRKDKDKDKDKVTGSN